LVNIKKCHSYQLLSRAVTDEKDGLGSVTDLWWEISSRKGKAQKGKEAPSGDRISQTAPKMKWTSGHGWQRQVGTAGTKQRRRQKGRARRRIQVTNTSMTKWKEKSGSATHIMACSRGDCTGSQEGVTSMTQSMSSKITNIVLGGEGTRWAGQQRLTNQLKDEMVRKMFGGPWGNWLFLCKALYYKH